jgi:plasmid rolling circle replication initiator protein Rep
LLSDISPKDKPWDKHRGFADTIQSHYNGSKFDRYSQRISFCSQLLEFGLKAAEDETIQLKLRSAKFCRVRHCPVCQWRRSLMWKAKAYQILPKIVSKYPTHRWLFMTLTQKNVPITDRELEDEPVDLIGEGDDELGEDYGRLLFGWRRSEKRYKMVD